MDEATTEQPTHEPAGRELLHTGNRAVDEVLASCAGLDRLDIAARLARLEAAERALTQILDASRDGGTVPLPGMTPGVERAS